MKKTLNISGAVLAFIASIWFYYLWKEVMSVYILCGAAASLVLVYYFVQEYFYIKDKENSDSTNKFTEHDK